ncbi:hypothetical protein [Flavobacterium enshiense]|uniref:YhhN-like protein n=1 Tax=Flavobacterium enshiense DK69 TaxID=1107311 RepID=A0A0A2MVV2_9FLAO|nr:hypothetical protein [Flavobacterium enshiense]KGO95701.1 hypothetical protein Q767_10825 [Flavobacterium enshiense DK69]
MTFQTKNNVINWLSILYFAVIAIYSVCVYLDFQTFKEIIGFFRIPILIVLYFYSSKEWNYIYFFALLFFQVSVVSFRINSEASLLYGVLASVVFKFLLFVLVYKAVDEKKWTIIIITALPILFVYLYLIDLVKDSLGDGHYPWVMNGFLTAFLGGLAVSDFITTASKKSFWLLISALLFVVQTGLFFINKFYLKQQVFLQLIILFYGISHYTFYKFMIMHEEKENSTNNQSK